MPSYSHNMGQNKHGHMSVSMTTGQTPSADEDHVTHLKAPENLLNRPRGETALSADDKLKT